MADSDNFLTRDQIDAIIETMTARDIFAGMPSQAGETPSGPEVAGKVFESAANRQGHGTEALDRVRPVDAMYLAEKLGEVFDMASPKSDSGEGSPPSADTSGSARKK